MLTSTTVYYPSRYLSDESKKPSLKEVVLGGENGRRVSTRRDKVGSYNLALRYAIFRSYSRVPDPLPFVDYPRFL